jgi:hypothetical protein
VVAAPAPQGRAIAGPQRRATDCAPPPQDAEPVRQELGAVLTRARPQGPEHSDFDFGDLVVRGPVAVAERPLPPANGRATRHRARERLARRRSCWGHAGRSADHAAPARWCAGRWAKGLPARLPSDRAGPARAALLCRDRRLMWTARSELPADPRAGCAARAVPDCRATHSGPDPGSARQRPDQGPCSPRRP